MKRTGGEGLEEQEAKSQKLEQVLVTDISLRVYFALALGCDQIVLYALQAILPMARINQAVCINCRRPSEEPLKLGFCSSCQLLRPCNSCWESLVNQGEEANSRWIYPKEYSRCVVEDEQRIWLCSAHFYLWKTNGYRSNLSGEEAELTDAQSILGLVQAQKAQSSSSSVPEEDQESAWLEFKEGNGNLTRDWLKAAPLRVLDKLERLIVEQQKAVVGRPCWPFVLCKHCGCPITDPEAGCFTVADWREVDAESPGVKNQLRRLLGFRAHNWECWIGVEAWNYCLWDSDVFLCDDCDGELPPEHKDRRPLCAKTYDPELAELYED